MDDLGNVMTYEYTGVSNSLLGHSNDLSVTLEFPKCVNLEHEEGRGAVEVYSVSLALTEWATFGIYLAQRRLVASPVLLHRSPKLPLQRLWA